MTELMKIYNRLDAASTVYDAFVSVYINCISDNLDWITKEQEAVLRRVWDKAYIETADKINHVLENDFEIDDE